MPPKRKRQVTANKSSTPAKRLKLSKDDTLVSIQSTNPRAAKGSRTNKDLGKLPLKSERSLDGTVFRPLTRGQLSEVTSKKTGNKTASGKDDVGIKETKRKSTQIQGKKSKAKLTQNVGKPTAKPLNIAKPRQNVGQKKAAKNENVPTLTRKRSTRLAGKTEKTQTQAARPTFQEEIPDFSGEAPHLLHRSLEKICETQLKAPGKEKIWITGMTFLQNGELVITDLANSYLYLISNEYKMVSKLKTPSLPQDVCWSKTDPDHVYVTFTKGKSIGKVYIAPDKSLKLVKTFPTPGICRGIICVEQMLVFSVDLSSDNYQIHFTDFDGNLIRYLSKADFPENRMDLPIYIATNPQEDRICVMDVRLNSITIISLEGDKQFSYAYQRPKATMRGGCMDEDWGTFWAEMGDDTVFWLSPNGDNNIPLLTNTDGIQAPYQLAYHSSTKTLALSFESDIRKIFFYKVLQA